MNQETISFFPPNFDAVIFDFDGTIASTGSIWKRVDQTFLEKRGKVWTSDYAHGLAARGFADGAVYTIELYDLDEDPKDICEEWREMAQALYRAEAELRPGVLAYIEALKAAGIPIALATTNDGETLATLRPRIDVEAIFDSCVYGEDVARNKQFPDIYYKAASNLGVSPARTLVFEDIADALRSANAAGCITCAVKTYDLKQPWDELCEIADTYLLDWCDIEL